MSEQESGQVSEQEKEAINNVEKFVDTIMVILPKYSTKIPEYCIKEEDWLSIKQVLNYIDKLKKENEEYHRIKKELIRVNKKIYDVDTIDELIITIDKLQKEIEKYKRLAKANLKDSQEFQDNMCNHRCIKNNEVLELKAEIEKKDKVIDLMATELNRRPLMIYLDNERDDRLVILDNPKEIIDYYTKKAEE